MEKRARVISLAAFSALTTIVVGVSLSWACTPETFGTPVTPAAPPPPPPTATAPATPGPPVAGSPAQPGAGGASAAPAPSATRGPGGSTVTSGATAPSRSPVGSRDESRARAKGVAEPIRSGGIVGSSNSSDRSASSDLARRASGATAGVIERGGGQPVFASSVAPKGKSSRASDAAASARSASGDLWSGFKPAARPSVFSAEAAAGQGGGSGAPVIAAIALGIGLTGLLGTLSLVALRRRRAAATPTRAGSGTTEM